MSHKTRSHYLITEKCASNAENPRGDEWTLEWTQREGEKAAPPQTGRGRYKEAAVS